MAACAECFKFMMEKLEKQRRSQEREMKKSYSRKCRHISRLSNDIARKYPFAFTAGSIPAYETKASSPRPLSILSNLHPQQNFLSVAPNRSRHNMSISPRNSNNSSAKKSMNGNSGYKSSPGLKVYSPVASFGPAVGKKRKRTARA